MHTPIKKMVLGAALIAASATSQALNIFACEPEWAALAKEIAPDASIYAATSALQDPHNVQARPSLIAQFRRADLAICSGAELEVGWLPMLQMKANNRDLRTGQPGMFFAAEVVETLDKLERVDRSMGDVHAAGNPHFHLSPSRVELVAKELTKRLGEVDGENRASYQQNLSDFLTRWSTATQRWETRAEVLNGNKYIAYHSSFRYLFDWLSLEQIGDLEPQPGLPPTPAHLASLLELSRSENVAAIVYTGYQDSRGAEWLSERTDIEESQLSYTASEAHPSLFDVYESLIDELMRLHDDK
ncbi:zinc ABC transporter substrate-binding protein [uncultured Umboniibacter sp.]|uniref:metal ABC transporter solute-binding protein, Zn/Mn family n=1 Tax=uncultured Umboniibacter sp. TaxID=1798917 RepID=UPI00262C7C8B|nr:zinc ABC transporter substrate-binding protein [uncultured Umboniibacter sp.]